MIKIDSIKSLKMLFWAVFVLQIIIALIGIILAPMVSSAAALTAEGAENFKTIIILMVLGAVPLAFALEGRKKKLIKGDMDMDTKFALYKSGFIAKMVVLSSINLLSVISFMFSRNSSFLYIVLILFVAYLLNIPSKEKIEELLQTESEDPESAIDE